MKQERLFQNPFTENFLPTWELWKDFRWEEHKFKYKGVISEQMAINRLVEVSEGDEEKAVRIVNQSISRGWMDFYDLKQPSKNGKSGAKKQPVKEEPEAGTYEDRVKAAFINRHGGQREDEGSSGNLKAV